MLTAQRGGRDFDSRYRSVTIPLRNSDVSSNRFGSGSTPATLGPQRGRVTAVRQSAPARSWRFVAAERSRHVESRQPGRHRGRRSHRTLHHAYVARPRPRGGLDEYGQGAAGPAGSGDANERRKSSLKNLSKSDRAARERGPVRQSTPYRQIKELSCQ